MHVLVTPLLYFIHSLIKRDKNVLFIQRIDFFLKKNKKNKIAKF